MQSIFQSVIGLEIHAQLSTSTKLFCGCSTNYDSPPNTNVCPVCLGHPGVLPLLNKKAVDNAIMMGLATNCVINNHSIFARKNYFYPDLPKGYQISQFEMPLCSNGCLNIALDGITKLIRINRIHLEEDAGKSIHTSNYETLIDVNRCGIPLIEIVSEPDINSAKEAAIFLQSIRQLVRYLGICDGNMEEGSLRCDANVSIKLIDEKKLGTKVEIKNMNSIKNVESAINHEIARQIDLVSSGIEIKQQTLLWDADKQTSEIMRTKEESDDYRYFPEPDLAPIILTEKDIEKIHKTLPELPNVKKARFKRDYSLPDYDIDILTLQKEIANYFDEVAKYTKNFKAISNWIMTDVMRVINEGGVEIINNIITPKRLASLINIIDDGSINSKIAKEVFPEILSSDKDPEIIVKEKNLIQINDSAEIEKRIQDVLEKNPKQVEEYLAGKEKVLGFFVGEIMKLTKGKANPQIINNLLRAKLQDFNCK